MEQYDFAGYATRTNVLCADGRTIMPNAFADNNGTTVPLVWNHDHKAPESVLGHALLENRSDGVYAYCKFNKTPSGQVAKECVENGDIDSLSIYANKLKQKGGAVYHGLIREVSLVLAGANPQAHIETVIKHSADNLDECEEEAMIYTTGDFPIEHCDKEYNPLAIYMPHADPAVQVPVTPEPVHYEPVNQPNYIQHSEGAMTMERTVQEVFNAMTDEEKNVVYLLVGAAVQDARGGSGDNMMHNAFEEENYEEGGVLTHSDMEDIIADAKRCGSLKESAIQHGIDDLQVLAHDGYGVTHVDYLFPDAKNYSTTPDFIDRRQEWVSTVMNGVHHTPFSRIKSIHADITGDEARALGYMKGSLKKEEVFSLLKRTTTPCTVYKKQKMDRDDVTDITDFDVVTWIKGEMRGKLNEELARAMLIGDGRLSSSDDKIDENCIRPIAKDADLYTIKRQVDQTGDASANAKEVIKDAVRARKLYRGTGNPTFFTTEDFLTEALLIEDGFGRRLYKDAGEVAAAMRMSSIVTVPVMENQTGPKGGALIGVAVNLTDYNVGADKGGAVNMFDDFDIDYNQQKYLIETRCSGALTKPYSAVVFESAAAATGD